MVHVEKNNAPNGLLADKWSSIKQDVLINTEHKASSACYRNTTIGALRKLYNNKCACCERSRGEELHVDHYRPKKARNNKKASEYNHSGYSWLTYEWTNLIPLCSSCNQSKSNYFPLIDNSKRVISHTDSLAQNIQQLQEYEEPLFVNPEIDLHPERHFKYLPNGEVEGRTNEGKITVELYKLNSRTKKRERREILEEYILDIRKILHRYHNTDNSYRNSRLEGGLDVIFEKIIENGNIDKPLSLMHDYLRRFFGAFIQNKFSPQCGSKLTTLFMDYQKKWHK